MQVESDFVSFEDPPVSVGAEVMGLGRGALVPILKHFEALMKGDRDFNEDKVWKSYRGVPLFIAEIGGN